MALLQLTTTNVSNPKVEQSVGTIEFGTVFDATIHGVTGVYLMSATGIVDLRVPGRQVCVVAFPYPIAHDYRESLTANLSVTF